MINKNHLKSSALQFNVMLDDTALERFDRYAELLVFWNKRINLTTITEPREIEEKHFLDSLAFLKYTSPTKNSSLIDIGTGAGFPGLALLIARPDLKITLLDSTKKKLNVIENILNELHLSANLIHMRAEEAGQNPEFREKYDYSTARAVANLRDLSEYCLPFVKLHGEFIALKGSSGKDELNEGKAAITLLGGKTQGFYTFKLPDGSERSIIKIKKIKNTPKKYPRPSAKIARTPLI
ncbi:MAG: 16S rRNA (guanine(527)-N(7))-methyltransferase RsmG [Ruminococcaceae bacterium]|nr:16S rRNA (guanine(527)-N(7))-methyltransferase RsmG [Oscillospiraceae bacterium]